MVGTVLNDPRIENLFHHHFEAAFEAIEGIVADVTGYNTILGEMKDSKHSSTYSPEEIRKVAEKIDQLQAIEAVKKELSVKSLFQHYKLIAKVGDVRKEVHQGMVDLLSDRENQRRLGSYFDVSLDEVQGLIELIQPEHVSLDGSWEFVPAADSADV